MPDTMKDLESFGVDHYRPKSRFPALANVYANLFYCCNPCNRRKGDYWPAKGSRNVVPNPCDHEMFSHLRFEGATVRARSRPGQFTSDLLDLNDPSAVSFRQFVLDVIAQSEDFLQGAERNLAALRKELEGASDQTQQELLEKAIADLVDHKVRTESHLKRLLGE